MTKPIEWTTPAKTVTVPGDTLRLDVRYPIWEDGERMGHSWRDATPSDLVAAISAMGEGEREEVLRASGAAESFDMQTAIIADLRTRLKEATRLHSEAESALDVERTLRRNDARYADAKLNEAAARAEKAERERDELGAQLSAAELQYTHQGLLLEQQRERADQKAAAHSDLAVAHRKALLDLDDARKERDRSNHLRAGMLPDTRLELGALGCEDVAVAARRVVAERNRAQEERDKALAEQERLLQSNARYSRAADEAIRDRDAALGERNRAQAERDDLRVKNDGLRDCLAERKTICEDAIKRAVAAETAAAQLAPREYPLAEGSRWEGDMIVDNCNLATRISDGGWRPLVVSRGHTSPYLADVLALAHRRGLL